MPSVIEDNALTYYHGLVRLLGGHYVDQDDITWFTTGRRGLSRFNGVLRTTAAIADLSRVVDPVLALFVARALPFFYVDWPSVSTPGLGDYLRATGLPLLTFTMPAMARGLSGVPASCPPIEIEITPVVTGQDQADWLNVLMQGFDEPETTRSDFQEFLANSLAEPGADFEHFLGHWQGQACAISTLLHAHQSAGIYHVATLPAYRGRGLGRALTLAAMHAAQAAGHATATLFATPAGYPLYQRLGFETIATADLLVWDGRGVPA